MKAREILLLREMLDISKEIFFHNGLSGLRLEVILDSPTLSAIMIVDFPSGTTFLSQHRQTSPNCHF